MGGVHFFSAEVDEGMRNGKGGGQSDEFGRVVVVVCVCVEVV